MCTKLRGLVSFESQCSVMELTSPDSEIVRERGEGGPCPGAHVMLMSLKSGPNEAGLRIALPNGGEGAVSESLPQRGLASLSDPPSSASFDDDEIGEAVRPGSPFSDVGMAYRKFA